MRADFLGRGFPFPVDVKATDAELELSEGEEHIEQAVFLILATAPGERVMRPEFGCGIHDLVFAPNTAATMGRIEQEVRLALTRWAPRIDVLDVNPELRGDGNVVLINIHYRIRSTNNLFNMVYPFYLDRGARP